MPEIKEDIVEKIEEEQQIEIRNKSRVGEYVWKTSLVIGLFALLILGILLPIRIVPNVVADLRKSVASFWTSKQAVSIDKKEIASGDAFTLDLSNASSTDPATNAYSISYPCRDGVYLEYSKNATSTDQGRETISCETPFIFTSDTKQITFHAFSITQQNVEQPIDIFVTPLPDGTATTTGSESKVGTVTLTIINPSATATIPTNSAATSTASTPTPSDHEITTVTTVNGGPGTTSPATSSPSTHPVATPKPTAPVIPTDLVLSGLRVGTIINGQFVDAATVRSTDPIAVRFIVSNPGKSSAGGWTFDAYLPTLDPRFSIYHSPAQASIGQSSGIVNTLSLNNLSPGQQAITVIVDPSSRVSDSNRSNNRASIQINVVQ